MNTDAGGARPPLRASFYRIWVGQTLSTIGSELSAIGVAVYVYLETGSELWLGILAALAGLPFVFVGPFLGLVDRFQRRTVMLVADSFAVVGPTLALVLAAADRLEVWHLALAGFIGGVGTAIQLPAVQASVPSLVDHESYGRANGLMQLGPSIAVVAAPVLATPIVALWGIVAVLIIDVATFVVALFLTLFTPFTDVLDEADAADDRTWRSALAWLRRDGKPLLVLLGGLAVVNFLFAFFDIALLAIATNVGGAKQAGLALGAGGFAMIASSLLVGHRGIPAKRIPVFVEALLVTALGCAVVAIRPVFVLVVIGAAIAMSTLPLANAAIATVFHERVPLGMQGRVFGLRVAIGRALSPVGSIVAGALIAGIAAPALGDNGSLRGTLGQLIGEGEQRGAAAVMLGVAAALVALAAWLGMNRSVALLDDHAPSPVPVRAAAQPLDQVEWPAPPEPAWPPPQSIGRSR